MKNGGFVSQKHMFCALTPRRSEILSRFPPPANGRPTVVARASRLCSFAAMIQFITHAPTILHTTTPCPVQLSINDRLPVCFPSSEGIEGWYLVGKNKGGATNRCRVGRKRNRHSRQAAAHRGVPICSFLPVR